MSASLYDTLGVSQSASADEIKKAYRRLARKYHPDINKEKGAEEKFKEINAAYEILKDDGKRRQYDQHGDSMFGGQNFHDFASSQGGADLDEILRSMFGGGMNGGRSGFGGFSSSGFSGANFGGFQAPDLDVEARITVPFDVAILGGKHSISYGGENFDIKIPAGIKNGEKMRLKGKGKSYQRQKGDLFLSVEVSNSPEYERDENDLIKNFDISLKTALFGGKVNIQTPYKKVTLKVKENTKNSQKFRVKGYGVIDRKSQIKGDLYLRANIVLPSVENLDEDLKKAMKDKLPEK